MKQLALGLGDPPDFFGHLLAGGSQFAVRVVTAGRMAIDAGNGATGRHSWTYAADGVRC
jgi:hypothetical protein